MNEELDRRFEEVNRRMDQGFEEVHRGMEELRQETRELRQETRELRQETTELRRGVRKNGVMVEKLDGDIRLVAEGVVTNRQIMEGFIEESRREREEDRRLWRRLFGGHEQRFQQVEGRVDGLEVRVGALESRDR
jgi:chromosome segregation ATPase